MEFEAISLIGWIRWKKNNKLKKMNTMEIPKTTEDKPYIEFRFNKKGELIELLATNVWWGGINGSFVSTNGYEGNTCEPKDLQKFIKAYKLKKVKDIEKEIEILKTKLQKMREIWLF